MSGEVMQLVEKYVYENYPTYKEKQLIIKEQDSHFKVYRHKDGSPLILSKEIINKNNK